MRDPYSVLGVKQNAAADEIKAAWRAKAKNLHPDHNQDDPSAASRFAEVGQAYDVLKDPERRKRYDRAAEMQQTIMEQRQAAREAAERAKAAKANAEKVMEELARAGTERAQARGQAQSPPPGETPEDMIERIFGAGTDEQAKARTAPKGSAPVDEHSAEIPKSEQAGEKPPLPVMAVDLISSLVRRIRGTAPQPEKAPDIVADVSITIEDLLKQNSVTVKLADEREIRFVLEKGMTEGQIVRLKGQGLKVGGMKPGDLLVTLKVARDARFRVEGFDLHTTLPISLEDAVLGADAAVETPEGNRGITIPAWSGSDQTLRIEGLGLHDGTGGRGDLVVELRIVLWEKPNEKVTDLMRHMRHGLYL